MADLGFSTEKHFKPSQPKASRRRHLLDVFLTGYDQKLMAGAAVRRGRHTQEHGCGRTSRRDLYFVVFIIARMWAVSTAHCVAQRFKWDHRVASWGIADNIEWLGKTFASKDAGVTGVVGYVGLTPAWLTKMVTGVFQVRVWALEVLTTWTWQLLSIGLLQRQSNSKRKRKKEKT